jgi:pimeloyl-ACP methyl ester carboxylesterase
MSVSAVSELSAAHGCEIAIVTGAMFPLLTVAPAVTDASHSDVLRVYIEGDGLAWRTRRHLSADPTPVNPVALRLMLADNAADKLYIARPCQYVQSVSCAPRFWSSDRFGAEVVNALSSVLDQVKSAKGYMQVELVGYSGGAGVALLLAAQRNDVLSVRTVAGNLDPDAFCRLHHVSPLTGSLNPINFADKLQHIEQLHFIGMDDAIVPVAIFNSYLHYFSDQHNIQVHHVVDVAHAEGWVERWSDLVQIAP